MATYWEKRALEIEAEAYLKSEEAYRFVSKEYRRAMGELERRLTVYLQRIADRHGLSLAKAQQMLSRGELEQFRMGLEEYIKAGKGELTPEIIRKMEDASDLHRLTRMQAIGLEMDQVVSRMTARYSGIARDLMVTGYLDGFYKMSYEIGVMNGFQTVQKVDEAGLATILRRPWTADGVEFSDRIWKNKEKLLNDLQRELWHATARGGEVESVVPRLAQRMKVSDSAARRLLHTEMTYFSTQGTMKAMEESGVVERYEFVATLDSHTSDVCRDMDGKIFKLSEKEVGLNSPPLHCHCRSVVVPYFGDDIEEELDETRMARDPETGESKRVEGGLTYHEWQEKYVAETPEKGYNGVAKKEFNLQFFGNPDDREVVEDALSKDPQRAALFYRLKKRFDDATGLGKFSIVTPIGCVTHTEDRFYHVYNKHEKEVSKKTYVKKVLTTLSDPDSVYQTRDANGLSAVTYFRKFAANTQLAVITRNKKGFRSAYTMGDNQAKKLKANGRLIYERP